jgi:hypothetical protein
MFLGLPNSFAVDASLLDGHGGYAYFSWQTSKEDLTSELYKFSVFRYNLVDSEAEFMEPLPREWNDDKCTWLVPKPSVSPIQVHTPRHISKLISFRCSLILSSHQASRTIYY